ncbi:MULTISPECIES: 7-cyano-7-deazaguanine synthase QueC [unclassified Acidisoma]|jgi:7-cyano-7-deazaguanine synthase|uniref:7-cyano-7-deazaguanine synthase QueC n=1 Tax=unclassified Acidisoma TaxID=2634065 RepID=UPI00131E499B|nr:MULTISPECIES: 7-cyano-7-deazaguanine synthase QueC [unclassified Acidisoma]
MTIAETPSEDAALVMFSGGQDSTTCLAWALDRYRQVETVGFNYGQRHAVELECRAPVREAIGTIGDWGSRLGSDHLVDLRGALAGVGATAMTAAVAIEATAQNLPNTFVPGRNLMFLTAAAGIAWRRGIKRIIGGMCETDYSGYPDCRDDTIKAMQVALNLGMQTRFVVEMPLMWIDKAATWAMAQSLGGQALIEVVSELTHSCYLGDRRHRHDWGYGCGNCPACDLRASGWMRWRSQTSPAHHAESATRG